MSTRKAKAAKKPVKRTKRRERIDPETQRRLELRNELPFVRGDGKESWWRVPETGGYVGGNEAGNACAAAYMKYLREVGVRDSGGTLQHIVLGMMAGRRDNSSLRGQVVGFFSAIDYYLQRAAALDAGLDFLTFEELRKRTDKFLALTNAETTEYLDSLHKRYKQSLSKQ